MDLLVATETQLTVYSINNNSTWQSIATVTPCSSADCVSQVQLAPNGEYALALSESGRNLFQIPLASLSDQLSHRQLAVAGQHSCIALSPRTGRSLIAGSHTGQLTAYDAPEIRCRWQRPSLASPVTCLAFDGAASSTTSDDSRCLVGYQSGDIVVVNIGTGYRHPPMGLRTDNRSACECLATSRFSAGLAAAGYRNGTLLLWDVGAGSSRCLLVDGGCVQPQRAVQFSPVNASLLCSASSDASVGLYDSVAGLEVGRIRLPDAATRALAFSPDGQIVLVGTLASGCLAYDLRRMRQPVLHIPAAAVAPAAGCADSARGGRLAVRDLLLLPQQGREFDSAESPPAEHLAGNENRISSVRIPKSAAVSASMASPLADATNVNRALVDQDQTASATKDSSGVSDSSAEGRALDRILMAPLQLNTTTLAAGDQTLSNSAAPQLAKRVTFADSFAIAYPACAASSNNSSGNLSAPLKIDAACQTADDYTTEAGAGSSSMLSCVKPADENRIRQLIREETVELRRQLADLRYQLVHQLDITETNLIDAIRQAVIDASGAAAASANADQGDNELGLKMKLPFGKF